MFFLYLHQKGYNPMNSTVQLVNEWAAFEAQHADANIEEFCRYYLIRKKESEDANSVFGEEHTPPTSHLVLMKMMGMIMRFSSIYISMAIKDLEIRREEDFYFLNYIRSEKNPRKTEIIHAFMYELTTGLSILAGLKELGLIEELEDPEDKRSKRVSLTPHGEKVLFSCYKQFGKVGAMLFKDIPDEDSKLCVQLLQKVVVRYMPVVGHHKGRDFEELFREAMGRMGEDPG
jgi:DNA-binding MarR family transcriptional regulator